MNARIPIYVTCLGYSIFTLLYAIIKHYEVEELLPWVISFPAWFLSAVVFRKTGMKEWTIGLALFLSGIGDYVGAKHLFIFQILFFALAHVSYIIGFARHFYWNLFSAFLTFALFVVMAYLAYRIIPHIADDLERICVFTYIIIIYVMALLAFFQKRKGYVIAAILFVFSDALIAWGIYVERFPYQFYMIMTTYFLAQFLFAIVPLYYASNTQK